MKRKLGKDFFNRRTEQVALELLGKFLVRRTNAGIVAAMITEVEVYDGPSDRGSHAYRGRTLRNAPMFGPPGHWYVFFTYGMHWMVNVTTREGGYPAAVLLRGVLGASGPGRVTKTLGITGELGGKKVALASGLWIEDRGIRVSPQKIKKGPRIGIDYAGPYWARRRWRFRWEPPTAVE